MDRQVFQPDPCENDTRIALSNSQPLGPMRIVKVSKGDVVSAQVDASYTTLATQQNGSGLSAFLQLNGSNPPGQDGSNVNRPALSVGILYNPASPPSTSVPRAYLRLLAYNSAGKVIRDEPVYVNSQDCLGKLATSAYRIEQDGYVRIYLASESDAPATFDNLSITHQQAMIVQEHHYDPFGLHLTGIEKEGSYPYQYNGLSEQQADPTGKGYLYETDWRGYDPQLGRFKGIDALAHSMPGINPYQYSYHNPVMFNDPTGEMPWGIAVGAFIGGASAGYAAWQGGANMGQTLLATLAGAALGGFTGGLIAGDITLSGLGAGAGKALAGAAKATGAIARNVGSDALLASMNGTTAEHGVPLTYQGFTQLAHANGMYNPMDIGNVWDRAVKQAFSGVGRTKKDVTFPTNVRETSVRPDLVGPSVYVRNIVGMNPWQLADKAFRGDPIFKNGAFYEAKYTEFIDYDCCGMRNQGQLRGMIEVLSRETSSNFPGMNASQMGSAALFLITPWNTVIAPNLVNYAKGYSVNLYQIKPRLMPDGTIRFNNYPNVMWQKSGRSYAPISPLKRVRPYTTVQASYWFCNHV